MIMLFLNSSFGQKRKMSFERLKALKMSYITEKIGLNAADEPLFWEIYDRYEMRIYVDCRKKIKNLRRTYMKSRDSISNNEALEVIQKINELEQYALRLKEERDKSLLKKFSANLILEMHRAEYHFNRDMVYKMKKKDDFKN